jgi:hypothetical protein
MVGTGGVTGTGGMVGTGGVTGTGGMVGTGGVTGTGGSTGTSYAGVSCGGMTCNQGQICCISLMLASFMCTSPGSCQGDFTVTCDGPEDCGGAGHQCCLTSGAAIETSCVTGQCLAGRAMCHRDADCAEGESCCTATSLGYAHGSCQVGVCPSP